MTEYNRGVGIFPPMPTPSEQKALAFVAIIIVLGGAVRVLRASSPPMASPAEQQAIAYQAQAAETASVRAAARKSGNNGLKVARRRRNNGANIVGGVASVPPSDVRPGSPSGSDGTDLSPRGFPPPAPRIDVDNRLHTQTTVPQPGQRASSSSPPIDVDKATAAEIEALPRVGPALAARIVASRDSLGPFGSLEALGRVRGIGPAMLKQLRSRVTFSGRAASSGDRSRY